MLPRVWERSPEAGAARLEELRQLTRGALAEMRTLLLELRPQALLEADMGELLKQLVEAFAGRSRIPVTLEAGAGLELLPEVKVAYYRIVQEALNNITKHAGASRVSVSLAEEDGWLVLVVADDGKGFDPAGVPPTHLGLGIMQERAQQIGAELEIESGPGRARASRPGGIVDRSRHNDRPRDNPGATRRRPCCCAQRPERVPDGPTTISSWWARPAAARRLSTSASASNRTWC